MPGGSTTGAIAPVLPFEGADSGIAAGAPLDHAAIRPAVFVVLAGVAGSALAWDHHGAHAELVQVVLDAGLAVAAVGGDSPRATPSMGDDPGDRRASWGASAGLPHSTGVVMVLPGCWRPSPAQFCVCGRAWPARSATHSRARTHDEVEAAGPRGRAARSDVLKIGRGINRGAKRSRLKWFLQPPEVRRDTGVAW